VAGIIFIAIEVVLIAMVALVLVATGVGQLEGSTGIRRDGVLAGQTAPHWSLPDITGHDRGTPHGSVWQILLFTDHSLASYPGIVVGVNHLMRSVSSLEIIVLSQDGIEYCAMTARVLGLQAPIVPVKPTFYDPDVMC